MPRHMFLCELDAHTQPLLLMSESRPPYLAISPEETVPSTSELEPPLLPTTSEPRKAQNYSRALLRRSHSPTQRISASLNQLSSDKMRLAGLLNGSCAQSQPESCASASPGFLRRALGSAKRGRSWDMGLPDRSKLAVSSSCVPPNVEIPCPPSQSVPSQSHPDKGSTPDNLPGAARMPKMRTGLSDAPLARSAGNTPTPRQQSNLRFTLDFILASPSGSEKSLPMEAVSPEYLSLEVSRVSNERLRSIIQDPLLPRPGSISPEAPTAGSHALPSLNAYILGSNAAQVPHVEPLAPAGVGSQFIHASNHHAIPPLREGVSESRKAAHAHPEQVHIRPSGQAALRQQCPQPAAARPMALPRHGAYSLEKRAPREVDSTHGKPFNAEYSAGPPAPPDNLPRRKEHYEQILQISGTAQQIFPKPTYNLHGQVRMLPSGDGSGKIPPGFNRGPSCSRLLYAQQPNQAWSLKGGTPNTEQLPSSLPRQNPHARLYSIRRKGVGGTKRSGGKAKGSSNECDNCGKVFRTKQGYLRHKQTVQLVSVPPFCFLEDFVYLRDAFKVLYVFQNLTEPLHYVQLAVSLIFGKLGSLKKRPFKCDQCGASFGQKCSLQRHQKAVHHGADVRFECEHEGCAWAFSEYRLLQAHIKQFHDGALPFLCCVKGCTASFMWSSSHDSHMSSTHTAAERISTDWTLKPSSGV